MPTDAAITTDDYPRGPDQRELRWLVGVQETRDAPVDVPLALRKGPDDVFRPEPAPGAEDVADLAAQVSAIDMEQDAHHVRLNTLEAASDDHDTRIEVLEATSGGTGEVQELIDTTVAAHAQAADPHTAYDDLPSLRLLFENGLI